MSLSSIRARVDAATPGPWEAHANCGYCGITKRDRDNTPIWRADGATFGDGVFTAHAKTDIPLLLKVAEAAKELDEWAVDAMGRGFGDPQPITLCGRARFDKLRAALAELEAAE